MTRIGVMGGMFDPVHMGHVEAALAAIDRLGLDELRLIPCANPNHRGAAKASAGHRLAMLELAAALDARLRVDDREIRRGGVSYTVDTLRSLQAGQADARLVLVLGEDAFWSLPGWYRWRDIFQLCHLCVINRPPAPSTQETAVREAAIDNELRRRQVQTVEALFAGAHGGIFLLEKEALDIASSAVRAQIQAAETVPIAMRSTLPPGVSAYIAEHHLYS